MNAITIVEAAPALDLPPDLSCAEWIATGCDLMRRDRETKWQAADWMAYGRARAKTDSEFAEQMVLALPEILEDPKRMVALAKVAEIFPAAERTTAVPFEHFAVLASMPHGQARKMIEKAVREKTTLRELKYEVVGAQMEFEGAEPSDDDLLTAFLRHSNRLPKRVRLEALEILNEAKGGVVEP